MASVACSSSAQLRIAGYRMRMEQDNSPQPETPETPPSKDGGEDNVSEKLQRERVAGNTGVPIDPRDPKQSP